jgi:hypothetical protein
VSWRKSEIVHVKVAILTMILWILQPFFVFSSSTFRQISVQAHVTGFWMKINLVLVEGKWGEGDKVCFFIATN